MKLPLKSIEEYTGLSLELEDIKNILSSRIGEIENIENWADAYKGVYVAQITKKMNHPDADKLAIYKISIDQQDTIQVVAGDRSLEIGDRAAYIQPGNIVPSTYGTSEEFVIKPVKMRGVLSDGMLCSERELNLGSDHTRVMRLSNDAVIGQSFAMYFNLDDTVVDIENKALTNRGDLFGILGLAREISATKGIAFNSPEWYKNGTQIRESDDILLEIENSATSICPRYIGVVMDDITISESPIWLKSILIKSGIRPINNVVDITNYISILVGQPLHAFDYDKLVNGDPNGSKGAKIVIRMAKDGEKIHTLDGNLVELNSSVLVIADSTNPIAIAGVIGGTDTEIDINTKRIVIECANFDRFNIRKTSMSLGIFTDAVTRFTKALDPNKCLPIIQYTATLIEELSNGRIASRVVDIYPSKYEPKIVSVSIPKLNTHLGIDISKETISTILTNMEYEIVGDTDSDEYLTVKTPSFRMDISIPEDIHEDIVRIYGYENIHPILPLRYANAANKNRMIELKSRIRKILTNSGANEIETYSFISGKLMEKCNQDINMAYHIKNALSPDLEFMRTSLLSSALVKAQENVQRNINTLCMYEFNIAHQKGDLDKFGVPREQWNMSLIFTTKENIIDGNPYYEVKRYLTKVFDGINIEDIEYKLLNNSSQRDLPLWILNLIPMFNDRGAALIVHNDTIIGIMGDFKKDIKDTFKLPTYSAGLEIDLEKLLKSESIKKFRESSKYPAVVQDITFVVNRDIEYKEIEHIILNEIDTKDRKVSIECLDIYARDDIKKSITVRVSIEHMNRTLNKKDVEKIIQKLTDRINKI